MRPLKRFGIIGDIHCQHKTLEEVLKSIECSSPDAILSVGDITDCGVGDPDRCCELLKEHRVHVVQGNHDRWWTEGIRRGQPNATQELTTESSKFLSGLPVVMEFPTVHGPLLLCHGVGTKDYLRLTPWFQRYDPQGEGRQAVEELRAHWHHVCLVVGGHTHMQMVRKVTKSAVFINPGSLLPLQHPDDKEVGAGVVNLEESWVRFCNRTPDGIGLGQSIALP